MKKCLPHTSQMSLLHCTRFLKGVLPFTKSFFSPGIESGTRWSEKIDRALRESFYAIVLSTSDKLSSPWLHFETGSVSRTIARKEGHQNQAKVVPIRFDVAEDQMSGPLKAFQSREWSRDNATSCPKSHLN